MGKNIVQIIVTGQDLSDKDLKRVNENLDKLGVNLQKAGKIGITSGLAIQAGLGYAVKGFADMERGITNALTLVDAQGAEFADMEREMSGLASKLSMELGQSATDITEGFYQVLSSGAQAGTQGFEDLTETALKMARTTRLEVSSAVEMLSDTLHAYKMELGDAAEVADVFFQTSKLTATTIPQLSEAMRTAAPAAAGLNINLQTTAATLAALAAQGIKASEAGVAFRQIVLKLGAPVEEAKTLMDSLGISLFAADGSMRDLLDVFEDFRNATADMTDQQKAQTLETIAGERAFTKFGAILNTTDDQMRSWRDSLSQSGALQKGFETQMSSLSNQFAVAKESMELVRVEIGKALAPAVAGLTQQLIESAKAATMFVNANQDMVVGVAGLSVMLVGAGGLAASLGTVVRLAGLVAANFTAIMLAAGPVVWAIGALGAAFLLYRDNARSLNNELHRTERMLTDLEDRKVSISIDARSTGEVDFADLGVADTQEFTTEQLWNLILTPLLKISSTPEEVLHDAHVQQWLKEVKERTEDFVKMAPWELSPDITPGDFPYKTWKQIMEDSIGAGLDEDPIEVPPLKIWEDGEFEELAAKAAWMSQSINRSLSSGLMRMTNSTNKWRDSIVATFRSAVNSIIQEISRMVAKWITAKAIMTILQLPFGGGGGLPSVIAQPFGMAQSGGEVMIGSVGRDTVPMLLGKHENILDNDLNSRLRAFLTASEEGSGPGGITYINQPMLSSGSNFESMRMAHVVNDRLADYRSAVVVEGTA
jgi:TP901 family phage tail tape measure protein